MQAKAILFYGFKCPKEFNEKHQNYNVIGDLQIKLDKSKCQIYYSNKYIEYDGADSDYLKYIVASKHIELYEGDGLEKINIPKINPKWKEYLIKTAKQLNIKVNKKDIGWHWFIQYE